MINFSLNDKSNPVDPQIPDGVYDGVWHSSTTHINEFPEIQIPRDGAQMGMLLTPATFWIFKPYALIIEGESRGLSFPINLTFDKETEKLVAVDGGTDFLPYLPVNFDDYKDISDETKAKCFVFELAADNSVETVLPVELYVGTEQVEETLKIVENFRCPNCHEVLYTNKWGVESRLEISDGEIVYNYPGYRGPRVQQETEQNVLNLYFQKFDKKR